MSETMEREGREVLERLAQAGYEAYFVGGCVRDKLLGRPLKDIDIATSAMPDEVLGLFARTVPTGLKHGTVTVIMKEHPFEVTTFRKESAYEQFRRPKEVEFISDLNEDLQRRDFTINAMALSADGVLLDPYGGAADLAAGRVRAVGDPLERFHEDALRMLRGIRFACEYGFELEPDTWRALVTHAPLLVHVAMERVGAELDKMIEGRAPDRAVLLLARSGLSRHFKEPVDWPLTGWASEPAESAVLQPPLVEVEGPELRWTAFFARLRMLPAEAKEAMRRLKFAGKKTERIVKLLQADKWMERRLNRPPGEEEARREEGGAGFELMALGCVAFGKPVVREWLKLARWQAEARGDAEERDSRLAWIEAAERELERVPVDGVAELAVNGAELALELDKRPGPWLGELLHELLTEVALRRMPNERAALMRRATLLAKRDINK